MSLNQLPALCASTKHSSILSERGKSMDSCIYLSDISAVFNLKVCAKDWINALHTVGYLVPKQLEHAFLCTACPLLPGKECMCGGGFFLYLQSTVWIDEYVISISSDCRCREVFLWKACLHGQKTQHREYLSPKINKQLIQVFHSVGSLGPFGKKKPSSGSRSPLKKSPQLHLK